MLWFEHRLTLIVVSCQGGVVQIPNSKLNTSDADTLPGSLVYTVTSSLQGFVLLAGQNASRFTQVDLNNNLLSFAHDRSEGTQAGFYFTVTAGNTTLPEQLFNITVTTVDNIPAVTNLGASVAEVMGRAIVDSVCGIQL
jgi:hypothetical protein